ncbi:MAG: chemotaxis protein CheX [Bdellovibrio sp.]
MQNVLAKPEQKNKKNILILDHNSELEKLIKESLLKQTENSEVLPIVVRARDGADAAMKSANQKFDMVLIDMDAPRLMEGGFIYGLHTARNTHLARVFVVSPNETADLPESLKGSKFFKKPFNPDELIASFISTLNSLNQSSEKTNVPSGTHSSTTPKLGVDVRVVNAVITATTHVLTQYGLSIKMEKAIPRSPSEPLLGEISSIIDINSDSFHGYLSVSFDKSSYLELASAMLMEEQTELTADNQDAVGEINNIIFGNAKSEITSYGVQLTVPRVLIGANQSVSCSPKSAGMLIPFSTGKGKFYLTVVAQPIAKAG